MHKAAALCLIPLAWFLCCFCVVLAANPSLAGSAGNDSKHREMPTEEEMLALRHAVDEVDDNNDGEISSIETKDFVRSLPDGNKNSAAIDFKGAILLKDIEKSWLSSEVRSWSVEDAVQWLTHHVKLPQYEAAFRSAQVDGKSLLLLAAKVPDMLSRIHFKSAADKNRMTLKALDLVLYGPPHTHSSNASWIYLLSVSLLIAAVSFFFFDNKSKVSLALKKKMDDMSSLEKKCLDADVVQTYVRTASIPQTTPQHAPSETKPKFSRQSTVGVQMTKLEEQVQVLQDQLTASNAELQNLRAKIEQSQGLLQATFDKELDYVDMKKYIAESNKVAAQAQYEKIMEKKKSFLGSMRVANGPATDECEKLVMRAKLLFSEISQEKEERIRRWQQIQDLLDFTLESSSSPSPSSPTLKPSVSQLSLSNLGTRANSTSSSSSHVSSSDASQNKNNNSLNNNNNPNKNNNNGGNMKKN